ncbi:ABC transporter substrate-binding protein [Bradyrhizobium sp. LHD-71]|uniref:ABC transporter substrate-binding protein n=1 Tax=Bradyrhizobium sp. LHD-71 TaxID=3072141 RepID=UPI00280F26C3|nr:ABC transporter substrate-binding protein [Bradyrhizobium sp. LHD-71]MDQ8727187.1 ABC transporter substrate-binding protein [Bradyrhizobium sp. LHD-71]
MTRHGIRLLKFGVLAGTALAAMMPAHPTAAQETVKLGFTAALTGPFNEFGEGIRRGVEIAIEEWNKKGGVNGKKVELAEALDDQLVPDRAVQNMRRILDNEQIAALIAPSGSGPTLAVIDMLEADGRPVCNTQAQTPTIVYPKGPESPPRQNIFSLSIDNTVEAEKLAGVLASQYKKVGLLHESTGYGVTGAELIGKAIKAANQEATITSEAYNQRAQDMTAQLTRAQRAGAEVLMVVGLGADLAVIRKNMARLNINIPLYATAGGITPPYMEGAGNLVKGTRAASTKSFGLDEPPAATKTFLELYKAKHGFDRWWGNDPERPQISMATTVGTAYDCVNLLLNAMVKANSTKPKDIIKALEETKDFPAASIRAISFSPEKHRALTVDDLAVYEIDKQGDKVKLTIVQE